MLNSVIKERVSTSQSLQVLSPEAVNNCLLSGFHATCKYECIVRLHLQITFINLLITSHHIT